MNKIFYRVLIIAGVVFICTAAALFGYSRMEDFIAGRHASGLMGQISLVSEPADGYDDVTDVTFSSEQVMLIPVSYEGMDFNTIGFISVPKIGIMLPVIDRVNDDLLKISVCWYSGEMSPHPERMILTAHNYRSHFGLIGSLVVGDEVVFRANSGVVYGYVVTGLMEIAGDDEVALDSGEWELTLLTCTRDRVRRVLVRCERVF